MKSKVKTLLEESSKDYLFYLSTKLYLKMKKNSYFVIFIINTGQFSLKELPIYGNPLHSISALNFAKAIFKDIISLDF